MKLLARGLITLAVLFVVVEVVLRVTGVAPSWEQPFVHEDKFSLRFAENPALGYEPIPGYRDIRPDAHLSFQRINSHGFRDKERTFQKKSRQRVIVVGGSTVFGQHTVIEDKHLMTRYLEKILIRKYGSRQFEVLNISVPNYNMMMRVELLHAKGLRYKPDIVILVSDALDYGKLYSLAAETNVPRRSPFAQAVLRISSLARWYAFKTNWQHFRGEFDLKYNVKRVRSFYEGRSTVDALRSFVSMAKEYGFKPLLLIWPEATSKGFAHSNLLPAADGDGERLIEAQAREAGVPTYSLIPSLEEEIRAKKEAGEWDEQAFPDAYFPDGAHASPKGMELCANALYRVLLSAGLIPPVEG